MSGQLIDHSGCRRRMVLPPDVRAHAAFSADCRYRTYLMQRWGQESYYALWAMMNPSAASINADDMTVAKTRRISRRLGFESQIVVNACSMVATDNRRLLEVEDPVGPDNLETIARLAKDASIIIVAHGKLPTGLQVHADNMVRVLRGCGRPLHVLGLSKDGTPKHPLARGAGHVPEDVVPVVWP